MSVVDEMHAYMAKLAASAKDPAKRARLERRRDVLDVLRRLRNLPYKHGLVEDGEVILNSRSTGEAQELLAKLVELDGGDVASMVHGCCVEGPATRPMRAVGVVTRTGVLTDSTERES